MKSKKFQPKKEPFDIHKVLTNSRFVHFSIIVFLLFGSTVLLLFFNRYIGFVTTVDTRGGTITTLIIEQKTQTEFWQGLYGIANMETGYNSTQTHLATPGGLDEKHLFFNCLSPTESEHEIYAARVSNLTFTDVSAAPVQMIQDYINASGVDRANNTFISTTNITVGSQIITDIPAVYTYENDITGTYFDTGALNVSGNLVFVSHIKTLHAGFKNQQSKYQMLVGVPNSSTTYYFYTDPNDVCPEGLGTGLLGDGFITGIVTDNATGLLINNVTVALGGVTNYTNASGFYNMSVPIGNHSMVAMKTGYFTNVSFVEINLSGTLRHNMSLAVFQAPGGVSVSFGNLSGFTKNNQTGAIITGATVNIQGRINYTDSNGLYNFTNLYNGTYNIHGVNDGFEAFIENVTIIGNVSNFFNLSFVPVNTSGVIFLRNGTLNGTVYNNQTNETLSGVTVAAAGQLTTTNSNGSYSLKLYEGEQVLAAIKSGYTNHIKRLNITFNQTLIYDVYLNPFVAGATPVNGTPLINGTVQGFVISSATSARQSNVTVSIAGVVTQTDSNGNYSVSVVEGTHNVVATKSGFNTYTSSVNVTEDNTTVHNISLTLVKTEGVGPGTTSATASAATAGAAATPKVEQTKRFPLTKKGEPYQISIVKILKKLRIGLYSDVPLSISNFGSSQIEVRFEIKGEVAPFVELSASSLSIAPGEEGTMSITVYAKGEPAVYSGELVISGDIEQTIPIDLLFYDAERIPLEALIVKITPFDRIVSQGSTFRYRVDFQNLLREDEYHVFLTHALENTNGEQSVLFEEEDITIRTTATLLKSFTIPADLEPGDYLLKMTVEYLGNAVDHKAAIKVVKPFYKYAVLGFPLWIIFTIMGILASGTFATVLYQQRAKKKKRYQSDIQGQNLPKAGPRSAYVGKIADTNVKTNFDLDKFQIHTIVAGSSGSGKTIAAQVLVEEALLKGTAVAVFDPNGQWTGFLRKNEDKKIAANYVKYGIKVTDARGFNGNIYQVSNALEIIDFKKFMKPGEINIFITSKLDTEGAEIFAANTIKQIFFANLPESPKLKFLMVYDGVHALLPKYGGTGKVFVQLERATREFRKWGVGIVLISQVLSDFPPEVLANINTQIQMRTRDEKDLTKLKEEYGEEVVKSVVKAAVGSGMVENAAYNQGKPYFISFRPVLHSIKRLSDDDLKNYDKYNIVIEDIEFQLEQLKEVGIDIFDFELELKLAKDKIKAGNFNMVGIYLEGLKPRLEKEWKKLGKEPKKYQMKLASKAEIEADLKQGAKQEPAKGEAMIDVKAEAKVVLPQLSSAQSTVKFLLDQIQQSVQRKDLQGALQIYQAMQQIYKGLSAEEKKKVIQYCNDAVAKITALKKGKG